MYVCPFWSNVYTMHGYGQQLPFENGDIPPKGGSMKNIFVTYPLLYHLNEYEIIIVLNQKFWTNVLTMAERSQLKLGIFPQKTAMW